MKKTRRKQHAIYVAFCILFVLSACSTASENTALDTCAPESELTITSSKSQVLEAESKNKDYISSYNTDTCYNITPDFIANNSAFSIFKYENSCASFLMYDNKLYLLSNYIGGYGITSMALADLNKDKQYELYFTFSWGSGIHRSQIGYFNPSTKKVTIFDDSIFVSDTILTTDTDGNLYVNSVTSDFYEQDSNVDFSVKAQDRIGSIVFKQNKITAEIDPEILKQKPNMPQPSKLERLKYFLEKIF
jgi:hypothetical protein